MIQRGRKGEEGGKAGNGFFFFNDDKRKEGSQGVNGLNDVQVSLFRFLEGESSIKSTGSTTATVFDLRDNH